MQPTKTIILVLAASLAMACGNDNNGNNGNNQTANNGNNQTANNGTANNQAANNQSNNASTNNTNNQTTNNGTTNNGTTNNTPGPEPTCDNYCDAVMANCTGQQAQYGSRDECIDYCENIGGWDAGEAGAVDGNTVACRVYHGGAPAAADPDTHCVHAGPTGGDMCGTWCDNYCQLVQKNCTDANSQYNNDAECMTACAAFGDTGTPGVGDYDTVQCRLYHAGAPAAADPATHCPHTGAEPTAFCVDTPQTFRFSTDAPNTYTRVDRMGMPAVSTALITAKDAYNDADPADDVAGDFVADIVANLTGIHTALDDDLLGLGLVPCSMSDVDSDGLPDCVGQEVAPGGPNVAALVLPDTLKIDPAAAAGFPNGRRLSDPVIDVTLSVILLDMSVPAQNPTTLVGVNPTANDLGTEGAFLSSFPYLHPPHTP